MTTARTRPTAPAAPRFGDALPAARFSLEALDLLARRRSTPAIKLAEPGPSPACVDDLLRIAARAPDHGKLAPWRFVVFEGAAREAAGRVLRDAFAAREPDAEPARLDAEAGRFLRAPVVIAVVSTAREDHKIPEWEQILSAGAVCQNLLIAAHAAGFAGQWLTEWYAYDKAARAAFGLRPGERIAGYVYLGSTAEDAIERARPDVAALTTRWTG